MASTTSPPAESKFKPPIEAAELSDAEKKLMARLVEALKEKDRTATETQLITHIRRFGHLGKTDEEKFQVTLEKLNGMLDLRAKYQLDTILERPWPFKDISFDECAKIWPVFMYKRSHEGLPFLYDGLGSADPKEAMKIFSGSKENEQRIREYLFRIYENFMRIKDKLAEERKLRLYKHVIVMDTYNISIMSMGSYKHLAKSVVSEIQILYPDTSRTIYAINTGWLFRAVWAFVCLFVDKITQDKVQMFGSDWQAKLSALGYGAEMIPKLFKGKSEEEPLLGGDFAFPELLPLATGTEAAPEEKEPQKTQPEEDATNAKSEPPVAEAPAEAKQE